MGDKGLLDKGLKRLLMAPPALQNFALQGLLERLDGKQADKLLLTARETARMLGISEMSLYRMRRKKIISPVMILPGAPRYRFVDVKALAAGEVAQ